MSRILICKDKEQNTLLEARKLNETENIQYEVLEAPEIEQRDGYAGTYVLNEDGNVVIKYEKTGPTFKEEKISESKQTLKKWLEDNPLFSTVHKEDGEYYSVTEEKQALLTQNLLLAQMKQSTTTTWNCQGGVCEEWTVQELSQLALEIEAYVKPKIKQQQTYEVQINNCSTVEEVNKIEIKYETVA